MTDHDARQIIIALTAIVTAWSIAFLLTIAFGQPFLSDVVALADRVSSQAASGPCERLDSSLR